MNIIKSICVAFSMYSKIPMPRVEWNEKNMKYAMCFFPLIGAVIGGLMLLVRFLCGRFGFNTSVYAVVMTALPVLVSGGIHTDGFIDTVDALSSYGDQREKTRNFKRSAYGRICDNRCGNVLSVVFRIYDGDMGYKSYHSGECRLCFIAFAERIGNRHF